MINIQKESLPTMVKYVETSCSNIQLCNLSRYAIGYIVRGEKNLYYGDTKQTIKRGDVFFMGIGTHYVENLPDGNRPFEQIVVYYSAECIQRILINLSLNYSISVSNTHSCEQCRAYNHVAMATPPLLCYFFEHVASYLNEENFVHDQTAENIKMTELVYQILALKDCCLKSKLINNADELEDSFEQIIYSNLHNNLSIEELAEMSNRSLTSFKKEFKRHFKLPPHQWFITQRLMQSRLMLISTSKSISEIGNECSFPNTSHFIKLFKKHYGSTPATYRNHRVGPKSKSGNSIAGGEIGPQIAAPTGLADAVIELSV